MDGMAKTIQGNYMSEEEANEYFNGIHVVFEKVVRKIINEFQEPWSNNLSTNVRAIFGFWIRQSILHTIAFRELSIKGDLGMIGKVHTRQILEILLQVRELASKNVEEREQLSKKIIAYGLIDYREKLSSVVNDQPNRDGYKEVLEHLAKFDGDFVIEIEKDYKNNHNWFGTSFTQLGHSVNIGSEDLGNLYKFLSADSHGIFSVALEVSNPRPGFLDFRGYQNKAQYIYWVACELELATNLLLKVWNSSADVIGVNKID